MYVSSQEACKRFVAVETPAAIAEQLREDQRICQNGGLPTVLAHFVPQEHTEEADAIAKHLLPQCDTYIPLSVWRMQYAGVVDGIKGYLAQMEHLQSHEPNPINAASQNSAKSTEEEEEGLDKTNKLNESFDLRELNVTTRTLRLLLDANVIQESDTLPGILNALTKLTAAGGYQKNVPNLRFRNTKCYICRYTLQDAHPLYPALCRPCGDFNLAEGELSLPDNLKMKGRTALVTGGRINLGFHTALRLLRCGARVIVSSRYPQDAMIRYRAEPDSHSWLSSLRIIGADFRTAKDVFRLVATVKQILNEWETDDELAGRLFLLVNNAAQTLTDPIGAEKKAIANESRLRQLALENPHPVINNGYEASVRGGSLMPGGLLEAGGVREAQQGQLYESYSSQKTEEPRGRSKYSSIFSVQDNALIESTPNSKSSWVQSLHEIPYEDVITAHSVNTFVPLILIRELLPLMTSASELNSTKAESDVQPTAHIINVSSREGIFEGIPKSREKAAVHVHTNMTKAALNMITETEAADLWAKQRIAMNTVDPGYMSAAPEVRDSGIKPPIGFDDGAARVLWTIAVAEGKEDRPLGPI